MDQPPTRIIDTVALVIIRQGRLLLVRPRGKGAFYLPGGKIEPGETDTEALGREIQEELAVEVDRQTLRFLACIEAPAYGENPGTEVRMRCYLGELLGNPRPAAEIAELAHLAPADYRALGETAPAVLRLLDHLDRDR